MAVKNRTRDRITLEPTTAAIPEMHAFLAELGERMHWDRGAIDRLQLVGEEALLFLLRKEEEIQRDELLPIPVSAREVDGVLELELVSGPDAENIETLVRELPEEDRVSVGDVGLRILGHLATELRHEQFHDRNYLLVKVDSTPL